MDNRKHNNIHIMGIPEGEEREQGIENLFEEIRTSNFLNLVKEKDTQVQEAQRIPNKLDPKRPIPRHIIIKIIRVKDKETILKTTRENQVVTYKAYQLDCHLISQQKHFGPKGSRVKYSR